MTSAAHGTNRRREKGGARDGCASPLGQRPNHDACPAARVPLHASSSIATRRGWETRVSRAPRVPRARISKAGTTRSIGSSAPRPSNTPACPVRFPPAAGRWTSVADAHSWRPAKKFSRGPQSPDGGRRWTTRPRRSVQVRQSSRVYPSLAFADQHPVRCRTAGRNDAAPRDRFWVYRTLQKRKIFLNALGEPCRSTRAPIVSRRRTRSAPFFDGSICSRSKWTRVGTVGRGSVRSNFSARVSVAEPASNPPPPRGRARC